ncbi:hypothetical protein GALMADRAFT_254742 [Galerina marginata CBS 339.88]|uniref:Uncharacterized protein n=1 Tax=Galerina marginata (strain CBS 339.88) TaxID=685588 RepID=A0A067SSN7_GALM3|nr:hypothetical protein GALMADRAFT_254742 [Galerina marginata CBS 339.88]
MPTGHPDYRRSEALSPFYIPLPSTYRTLGNPGVISIGQSSPSNAAATYPWFQPSAYNFGGFGASPDQAASSDQPPQDVNVKVPSAGVNVGGQGASSGTVSIGGGKAVTNPPASASSDGGITVTGGNGRTSSGDVMGNGASISVSSGAATTPASTGQPPQKVNVTPPSGGVNTGAQDPNKGDLLASLSRLLANIGKPATGATSVNVPAGSGITVTGENGGVGFGGNEGNGGTVTVTKGGASGDAAVSASSPLPVA